MTSKDDDTLPLPGLSEDPSSNVTVDEDFIPTSQPHSTGSSKMSRNSEKSFNKSTEETESERFISESRIDDTLPPEALLNHDRDKSTDFIPDTGTKPSMTSHVNKEMSCKKKLPVFGTEDIFKAESNSLWESTKIPESPATNTQNQSVLDDTAAKMPLSSEEPGETCQESITEIIVNDSAETVDLEATPIKIKSSHSERILGKLEISCSPSSFDVDRCEETQIFDNSSVLLLEQPGTGCETSEKTENISEFTSEAMGGGSAGARREMNDFHSGFSPPSVIFSTKSEVTEKAALSTGLNGFPGKQEVQSNCMESNTGSVITRKIDFKLTVSCLVTFNTKANKVLQKIILNVNETPKPKPKPTYVDPASDNTSDKSKRHSTSSSGSVYSDKMGPFALPKKVSIISDQTDSSEEEFGLLPKKERRALERVPWSNEYLLPLKMDDIMQVSVENQELLKRPIPSPRKLANKRCNGVNYLKEILENSSSDKTSLSNLPTEESIRTTPPELNNSEETEEKETPETSETAHPEKTLENELEVDHREEEKEQPSAEATEDTSIKPKEKEPNDTNRSEKGDEEVDTTDKNLSLCDGLAVFARWTDKRYYSGVLCGCPKYERWDVKFDDGTSKSVREDFIMPAEWLKVGALVFAMRDDNYESGQIVDIKKGDEVNYVVELDTEKVEVSVKLSDLRLTDVMAGIVREKYKPLGGTPRGIAGIDFDNVLSGKRLREQRTPLRPVSVQSGNSDSKKKSSLKNKKSNANSLGSVKETPNKGNTEKKMRGLKSEDGHLVEDKIISTDSPSAGETPLRKNSKDGKKKAKPRSLSYEVEDVKEKKSKSWLAPDGTPIPGPSGVNFKKIKTKAKAEETKKNSPARSKAPKSEEKGKRKRKLDETTDDGVQKKSMKEGESRVKTRSRKG